MEKEKAKEKKKTIKQFLDESGQTQEQLAASILIA